MKENLDSESKIEEFPLWKKILDFPFFGYFSRKKQKEYQKAIEGLGERVEELSKENYRLILKKQKEKEELDNEIEELTASLEMEKEAREYTGLRLSEARGKNIELQRKLSKLEDKVNVSIPLRVINNLIETSQWPALYLTQDLVVLYGNSESKRYFGEKEVIGKGLWEFGVSDDEIDILKEQTIRNMKPFAYEVKKSKLRYWNIIPVKEDDGKVLGYALTNERSFINKVMELFRSANEGLKEKNHIILPSTPAEQYNT